MSKMARRHLLMLAAAAIAGVAVACGLRNPTPQMGDDSTVLKPRVQLTNVNNPPSKPTWNVRYYTPFAAVDRSTWSLVVDGLVEHPGSYGLSALQALPTITEETRMVCVEGWSAKAGVDGIYLCDTRRLGTG